MAAILLGVALSRGTFTKSADRVFNRSAEMMEKSALLLAQATPLPPWFNEHPQGEAGPATETTDPGVVPSGPASGPDQPQDDGTAPEEGADGWPEETGQSHGGGGGSFGGSGGSGVPFPGLPDFPVPTTVPPTQPTQIAVGNIGPATETEAALINQAAELLLASSVTFQLFDFVQGAAAAHFISDIIRTILQFDVPILMADLGGALAAVSHEVNPDHTVKLPPDGQVLLIFDRGWLATATKEMAAAVLAHEGWHVTQVFTGITDDFVHYPRVVDIEYEAFVAGAAAWNTMRGSQSEPTLNAGSSCVALGEARCKEILVTGFGYPTGSRNPT